MQHNDPLWRLRHALAGLALALLLSVLTAALAGRVLADMFGGDYNARVTVYGLLLLYVVVGARSIHMDNPPYARDPTTPALDVHRHLRSRCRGFTRRPCQTR